MSDELTNGRVTNRELDAKIEAVRQEQKAEHWRTRLIVVGLVAAPKIVPTLLGAFGVHLLWW